jgi:hypothetical protein
MPATQSQTTIPRIHLFHAWTRWSAPQTVPYRVPNVRQADAFLTFTRDEQYRSCTVCGAEQVRVV